MRKAFLWFSILVILGGVGFSTYSGFNTEWNWEEQPASACPDTTHGPADDAPAGAAAILPASEQAKCWTGGPESWGGILAGVAISVFGVILLTFAIIWNVLARKTSRLAGPAGFSDAPSAFGIPASGTFAGGTSPFPSTPAIPPSAPPPPPGRGAPAAPPSSTS